MRGDGADDGAGEPLVQPASVQPVGDDHVRCGEQLLTLGWPRRALVREKVTRRHAVAIGGKGWMLAQQVSFRWLNGEHLGTVVRQQARTPRCGGTVAHIEHA